jgi:DNA repair protein RecO
MAKGVRKPKSKLAGGIELFGVSDMTFIRGRGEIGTLISTRLIKHYGRIVHDIERVQLGYELIKMLNKATEDQPEPEYFEILEQAFKALDDPAISRELIRAWFSAQLLRQAGHSPNLRTDTEDQKLDADARYNFDFDAMAFSPKPEGHFKANDVKFLRLMFSGNRPEVLGHVQNSDNLTKMAQPLVQTMLQTYIRQ